MIKGIKVFGERGAGNNYIMHLLDTNFSLEFRTRSPHINKAMGWTHGIPPNYPDNQEDYLFVCIVKNPYSWLLSFKSKPHTEIKKKYNKMNFMQYLRHSIEQRETPIMLWNVKNYSYVELKKKVKHCYIVRYEDVLEKPKRIMDDIHKRFGLTKGGEYFSPIIRETHASGKLLLNFFDRKKYYLEEKWRGELDRKHIDFINAHLDKDLMKKLNYKIL